MAKKLINLKTCNNCGKVYDVLFYRCPHCETQNMDKKISRTSNKIFYVDVLRQVLLFVFGFLFFNFFATIVSILVSLYAKGVCPNETSLKVFSIMLTNAISYTIIIIILTAIMWPFLNLLFFEFTQKKSWIYGVLGGIALIGTSFIYSLIVSTFYETSGNANQLVVNSMVHYYPLPCLLLIGIIGPVVEEFAYRVGLFSFLSRINRYLAYILTILIFAFIHFNFQFANVDELINELINIPSYVIAGIILCYVYEKSSFAGSTIAHVINNAYGVIMMILANLLLQNV